MHSITFIPTITLHSHVTRHLGLALRKSCIYSVFPPPNTCPQQQVCPTTLANTTRLTCVVPQPGCDNTRE
eukprot:5457103-Prymnesium_polylepis.1